MTLGSDFSGGYDLDPSMREVSGQRALAQAIIRRLTTTNGALQDHPDYGLNLTDMIGTMVDEDQLAQLITAQIFLEEEIEDASVIVALDGESLSINMRLTSGEAPFELTLNVSEVGVDAIIPAEL